MYRVAVEVEVPIAAYLLLTGSSFTITITLALVVVRNVRRCFVKHALNRPPAHCSVRVYCFVLGLFAILDYTLLHPIVALLSIIV
jgi:hypothetical protein